MNEKKNVQRKINVGIVTVTQEYRRSVLLSEEDTFNTLVLCNISQILFCVCFLLLFFFFFLLFFFYFFFEKHSHSISLTVVMENLMQTRFSLNSEICLPTYLGCWDLRCVLPHLASFCVYLFFHMNFLSLLISVCR